ncbi:hypothetical protein CPB85DRAFT_1251707 [Mucidula mucida]|nr:hypothetical protein CPB85DRAFT_1251707 [Mucidula mucida]
MSSRRKNNLPEEPDPPSSTRSKGKSRSSYANPTTASASKVKGKEKDVTSPSPAPANSSSKKKKDKKKKNKDLQEPTQRSSRLNTSGIETVTAVDEPVTEQEPSHQSSQPEVTPVNEEALQTTEEWVNATEGNEMSAVAMARLYREYAEEPANDRMDSVQEQVIFYETYILVRDDIIQRSDMRISKLPEFTLQPVFLEAVDNVVQSLQEHLNQAASISGLPRAWRIDPTGLYSQTINYGANDYRTLDTGRQALLEGEYKWERLLLIDESFKDIREVAASPSKRSFGFPPYNPLFYAEPLGASVSNPLGSSRGYQPQGLYGIPEDYGSEDEVEEGLQTPTPLRPPTASYRFAGRQEPASNYSFNMSTAGTKFKAKKNFFSGPMGEFSTPRSHTEDKGKSPRNAGWEHTRAAGPTPSRMFTAAKDTPQSTRTAPLPRQTSSSLQQVPPSSVPQPRGTTRPQAGHTPSPSHSRRNDPDVNKSEHHLVHSQPRSQPQEASEASRASRTSQRAPNVGRPNSHASVPTASRHTPLGTPPASVPRRSQHTPSGSPNPSRHSTAPPDPPSSSHGGASNR